MRATPFLLVTLALPAFAQAPFEPTWIPTFGASPGPGVGPVQAATVFDDGSGPALYAGGSGTTGEHVSRWDGVAWTSLGGGVNGPVYALLGFDDGTGPALYVGGDFTQAGGQPADGIAKWDGTSWSALGSGLGWVRALAVYDDGGGPALHAGVQYLGASGPSGPYIARWDGASWSAVGGGTNGSVFALAVYDDGGGPALFAGGYFQEAGGLPIFNLARWDGAAWSDVGGAGIVHALYVHDDGSGESLFVGGDFTHAGGVPAKNVARWDGTAWSPLAGGTYGDPVTSFLDFDDGGGPALFVGGSFLAVDGAPSYSGTHYLAKWDGQGWSALATACPLQVHSLVSYDEGGGPKLFAGISQGSGHQSGLLRFEGAEWTTLGDGLDKYVSGLAVFDEGGGPDLFAAGAFHVAGGSAVYGLARWDGETWSPLDLGFGSGYPQSLQVLDDGAGPALYLCDYSNGVSRWDGAAWTTLGSDFGFSAISAPVALAVFDDGTGPSLYAGGQFAMVDGVGIDNVARWDGSAWVDVGGGLVHTVNDLQVFDDGSGPALYACSMAVGGFGAPATHVWRWDGTSWSAVDNAPTPGFPQTVYALEVHDDGTGPALYAGGDFDQIGGVAADGVARWDGTSWSALGAGIPVSTYGVQVSALASIDDGTGHALYAGGEFTSAGGQPALNLARWDGATWSALGSGTDDQVRALAQFDDGTGPALYVGGSFEHALDSGDAHLAKWGVPALVPIPGCFGNQAVLSTSAKAAKLGAPFPLALDAGAVQDGTAFLFGGGGGVDASGCGVLAPGIGELFLGPAPFPLVPAALTGGAASFPIAVPPTPGLAGATVFLAAVSLGAAPVAALELSTALAVRIF